MCVVEVVPDSPAEEVGLLGGDVITAVAREVMNSIQDSVAHLNSVRSGDSVSLTTYHANRNTLMVVTVKLALEE